MVNSRMHIICGNCGCNDEFVFSVEEGEVCISCKNCATIHNLSDFIPEDIKSNPRANCPPLCSKCMTIHKPEEHCPIFIKGIR